MPQPRIAILIPAYNEGGNIAALLRDFDATLAALPAYDFTILFVDDGSSDDTAAILERVAAADPRIGVIGRPLYLVRKTVGVQATLHGSAP